MFSNSEEAATKHNYGHEGKWEEHVSFLNMQKDKGKNETSYENETSVLRYVEVRNR